MAVTSVLLSALFLSLFLIAQLPWGNCPLSCQQLSIAVSSIILKAIAVSSIVLEAKTVMTAVALILVRFFKVRTVDQAVMPLYTLTSSLRCALAIIKCCMLLYIHLYRYISRLQYITLVYVQVCCYCIVMTSYNYVFNKHSACLLSCYILLTYMYVVFV